MKTTSLVTFSALALAPMLMADEPAPQAAKPLPEIKIAICGGVRPAPVGSLKELKDMEANDESIQSYLKKEEAKTTIDKLNSPLILKSMEEALKHLTRDSMERIADEVDFDKEQLAIFVWQGSGQDRLSGHMTSPLGAANFHYNVGRTRDLKTHCTIYVTPKNCMMHVIEIEQDIIRCGLPEIQNGAAPVPMPKAHFDIKPAQEPK